MIRYGYGLLYTVFVVFLTLHLVNIFCKQKDLKVWTRFLIIIEWLCMLTVLSYAVDKVAIRLPIIVVIGIVNILLLYDSTIWKTMLLELFASIISIFSDYIVYLFARIWNLLDNVNEVFDNTISYYLGIVSLIIQLMILLFIERIFKKVDGKRVSVNLWLRYLIFPLFSMLVMLVLLFSVEYDISENMGAALTMLAIGLAAMNIYVFYFLRNDINRQLEAERLNMIYHDADNLQKMYQRLNDERTRLGKENHEFKNTVSVWSRLLSNKEYDKLNDLMNNVSTMQFDRANVFCTGNDTVDIILNDKFFEADGHGINFIVDIKDLTNISIQDEDIIILLSNVLNNAIEACAGVENPIIFVKLADKQGNFVFTVKNSYSGKSNPDMQTTKSDKLHHGYGVSNVKSIVDKHKGNYRVVQENGMFTTYILIPRGE